MEDLVKKAKEFSIKVHAGQYYVEGARLIAIECRGVNVFMDEKFAEAYQVAINSKWLN